MAYSLSMDDVTRLTHAIDVLVSPLSRPSLDDWRREANRSLGDLLKADSVGFFMPVSDAAALFSEQHEPEKLAQVAEVPPPHLSDGTPAWARVLEFGVGTIESIYGEDAEQYWSSAYYRDFAEPDGAADTLAVGVSVDPDGGKTPTSAASVQLWRERGRRRFDERDEAVLRLARPAFCAGVSSWFSWRSVRRELLRTIDELGHAVRVYCPERGLVHQTPTLGALLAAEPRATRLERACEQIAESVGRRDRVARADDVACPAVRKVDTETARYTLRGSLYGGPPAGDRPVVLVAIERQTPIIQPASELRDRYRLTRAEVRVAAMLAARKTNAEIAAALFISPHTARRHTERVLRKLGVNSRRAVKAKIIR